MKRSVVRTNGCGAQSAFREARHVGLRAMYRVATRLGIYKKCNHQKRSNTRSDDRVTNIIEKQLRIVPQGCEVELTC